jgi:hypothetical protein
MHHVMRNFEAMNSLYLGGDELDDMVSSVFTSVAIVLS